MGETHYTKDFELTLKAEDDLADGHFEGHAAVFSNVDMQNDKIQRNAFVETIQASKGRWPILMAHRIDSIIGFSTDAKEDFKGLWVRGELTLDSTAGKDAHAVMKHAAACGQKLGLSIGYRIPEGGAEYDERAGVRLLKNIDVLEFSVAAVPANLRARVSRVKEFSTIRDAERYLRQFGLTGDDAREFISFCKVERDAKHADEGALERDAKELQLRTGEDLMTNVRDLSTWFQIIGA